jgi:hypothetical protein
MTEIVKSMFADGTNGSVSSKRVITALAMLLCSTAFIANLFFKLTIDANIYSTMSYIVLGGLTATASEKFSSKSS